MKARQHKKQVAGIIDLTLDQFGDAKNHLKEIRASFLQDVCDKGKGFASVELAGGQYFLTFRLGQHETFCLVGSGSQPDQEMNGWLEEVQSQFSRFGFKFERRSVPNPEALVRQFAVNFGEQTNSEVPLS